MKSYRKNKSKYADGGFLSGMTSGDPLLGTVIQGGQMINSLMAKTLTPAVDSLDKSGGNVFAQGLKGALNGGASPIGVLSGLVTGMLGAKDNAKRIANEKRERTLMLSNQENQLSKINLSGYDTAGTGTSYYAKGGNITIDLPEGDYEVEEDEVVQGQPLLEESSQLSSDMHLVGGDRHENGGTQGKGGERVFSDRTKIQKDFIPMFKSYGIKRATTYADIAKAIGKDKGKAEEKMKSKMKPVMNTGRRILEDNNMALDVLFNLQEATKPATSNNVFAKGGKLPDPNAPKLNPNTTAKKGRPVFSSNASEQLVDIVYPSDSTYYKNPYSTDKEVKRFRTNTGSTVSEPANTAYQETYNNAYRSLVNQSIEGQKKVSNPMVPLTVYPTTPRSNSPIITMPRDTAVQDATKAYKKDIDGLELIDSKSLINMAKKGKINTTDTVGMTSADRYNVEQGWQQQKKKKFAEGGLLNGIAKGLKNNQGQIINGLNYISNLNSIKKLNTNVRRSYMPMRNSNYVDRSGLAKTDNFNSYNNTLKALGSSSQGVNGSNAGALYAATLNNNNQLTNNENNRRDAYYDNYNREVMSVAGYNTQIDNQAMQQEDAMLNEKNVAMPMQARNAFLQGYAGNTAMTQKTNLDKQRLLIQALANDSNGVMTRMFGFDSPEAQAKLRRNFQSYLE